LTRTIVGSAHRNRNRSHTAESTADATPATRTGGANTTSPAAVTLVKEVVIDDATMRDRFVICRNPDQAGRDRAVREQLLARLTEAIDGSDRLSPDERARLAGKLRAKASYNKFLRTTKAGLLRIDRAAVAAEAKLDGKFLLRTSDPTLTAEDVALGYKQLLEVERGWRDMKSTLDLRPVFTTSNAASAPTSCRMLRWPAVSSVRWRMVPAGPVKVARPRPARPAPLRPSRRRQRLNPAAPHTRNA
jgi:hypothetical protein